jgi:REP element-mobilizing transposase RayT
VPRPHETRPSLPEPSPASTQRHTGNILHHEVPASKESRGTTAALFKNHNTSWQDGYYDTHVKTSKQFEFVSRYIEQNPVARGLVEKPDEWEASSAKRKDLVTDPWPWLLD